MEEQVELQVEIPDEPVVSEIQETTIIDPPAGEIVVEVSEETTIVETPPREIYDTIHDVNFGSFVIYESANGWWVESGKVASLILAYKHGLIQKLALSYAGISSDQYLYFAELHPDFSRVRAICSGLLAVKAAIRRSNIIQSDKPTKEDDSVILSYLREVETKADLEANKPPEEGRTNITNNIIITPNEQIKGLVAETLERIARARENGVRSIPSVGGTLDGGMEGTA